MAGKTIAVPTIYLKTRAQWRAWLKKNHAKQKEIWLISYKKPTGKPTIPFEEALLTGCPRTGESDGFLDQDATIETG